MTDDANISEYLKQQIFIAFDSETTGLWAPVNRLVELAAIKFNLNIGEIDTFQSLINPGRKIPEEVIEIHGITDKMVENAPPASQVLKQFTDFCGKDSIMIAHNAPFDLSFLSSEFERTGLQFGGNIILDTIDIYQRFFPGLSSYSLLSLVKQTGISQSQEHRALSDAIFVSFLFRNAVKKFPPVNSIKDFEEILTIYKISDWNGEPVELPDEYADFNYAIKQNLRVEINYDHPVKSSQLRIIHPRQVHKLGSRYYVTAYCELAGAERTFRLDRILSYKVLPD